jgi:UDP-N-acetylmuramate--alanine ligase
MQSSRRTAEPLVSLATPVRCHVVGIGGPGMSPIARLLLEMGHVVSGSDVRESPVLDQLRALGALISIGHDAHHVQGADIVTYSTAIPMDNPELVEAQRLGKIVLHRSGVLASLCAETTAIGVAGTHGKTTSTALLTAMTSGGGLSPSSIIGAEVKGLVERFYGDGSLLIIEADESDGTLEVLPLTGALLTNVDIDHLDYFESFTAIQDCFLNVVRKVSGPIVLNIDDVGSKEIVKTLTNDGRVTTFGRDENATVRIVSTKSLANGMRVELQVGGHVVSSNLQIRGEHNAMNFAGAVAMAVRLGVDPVVACAAASEFEGVARRFTERGEFRGSLLIDDYAHLPAEIEASIEAARSHPGRTGRVIAVFQPNRYHRIASMADSYADCFHGADIVVITDVYASGTQKIDGVTGEMVSDAIVKAHSDAEVVWAPLRSDIVSAVSQRIKPGDICISMGCGDIETFPDDLRELRS